MKPSNGYLNLAVKREYFEQIVAFEKDEEYRLYNDYWRNRLEGKEFYEVVITLGYPKWDQTDRIIRFPWRGYTTKTITHPHFGSDPVKVFAIKLEL